MIAGDLEISLLKKRLEETEKAMERIVAQVVMLAMTMIKMLIVMSMVMFFGDDFCLETQCLTMVVVFVIPHTRWHIQYSLRSLLAFVSCIVSK